MQKRPALAVVFLYLVSLPVMGAEESGAESLTDNKLRSAADDPAEAPREVVKIIITGTRVERDPDLISKSVTVITRDEITARNPRTTLELLEQVPGVSLSRAGGIEGQVTTRGFNSNDARTLLLIDGDRFRGRIGLEYTLLDPNQIERIEVIRGPASALYGPDALAGVINVITRRAEGDIDGPFRLTPRLRALNYSSASDLFGGRVELEGLGNNVDMLLGVNGRTADNYESPQGEIPNSDFNTLSADLRLGYTPIPGHRFELSAKYAEVEAGRAGGILGAPGAPFVRRREDPLQERFVKLSYSGNNPEFSKNIKLEKLEASLYARQLFTDIDIENRPSPDRLSEVENIIDGPLVTGGKLLGALPWGASVLTVGTDFFHQQGKGTQTAVRTTIFNPDGSIAEVSGFPRRQTAPDNSQTDIGIFAHNDWDPSERWTVSLGGRVDYIRTDSETDPLLDESLREVFERGTETTEIPVTGGLGVIYRPWQTLHFTGNISKAFRAPATTESFGASRQGTGFLVPNPQLESEEGVTYEIGTRLRLPSLSANLAAFYNDYSNLIVSRPLIFQGLPSSQRVNAGTALIRGIELDANWAVAPRWQAFMNAAYVHGSDTGADTPLAYIPPLNGLFGVRYSGARGLFVEGVSKWSLRKDRIDPEQERETAGFATFDVYAGIDLWNVSSRLPEMQLSVGLENIFDKAYRQPTTVEDVRFARSLTNPLLEPGRTVSITLRSRF